MAGRNYFSTLLGLPGDGSGSPTAAVAAAKSSSRSNLPSSKRAVATSSSQASAASTAAASSSSQDTAAAAPAADTTAVLKPKPSRPKLQDPLVWIDLEMTGLNIEKDTIIEIACLVTDGELKQVVEGPSIAIHHPESVLENMNDWCKEHHAKSGLVQRVRDSSTSLAQAEAAVLAFVQEHTQYQAAQLAGNSVHVDRLFLQRHMPALLEHLHYRIVDVSTFKECCRRWKPKIARQAPRKVAAHTAMSDIKESLKELQYYKSVLFKAGK